LERFPNNNIYLYAKNKNFNFGYNYCERILKIEYQDLSSIFVSLLDNNKIVICDYAGLLYEINDKLTFRHNHSLWLNNTIRMVFISNTNDNISFEYQIENFNNNCQKIETNQHNIVDENIEMKTIKNPVILLIGIAKYESGKNLYGIYKDIQLMKHLWETIFGYSSIYSICDDNKFYYKKDDIHKFILNVRNNKINENNDGLIFYFTGHGGHESLLCSDNVAYQYDNIIKLFDDNNCPQLDRKPLLSFIDACRGREEIVIDCHSIKKAQTPVNHLLHNK